MAKIKILSTERLEIPKSLENIESEFDAIYYSYEERTFKSVNSWFLKATKKVDFVIKALSFLGKDNKQKKEIMSEILECSDFVGQTQKENAEYLKVQVNSSATLNFFNLKSLKDLELDVGHIYSTMNKMFLGMDTLKKFHKKDLVSFVFMHEFSHSAELNNNKKYGNLASDIPQGNPFHYLLGTLDILNDKEKYNQLSNYLISKGEEDRIPNRGLVKGLKTLYGEIYADVGGLLLVRNKQIKDGTFNPEKFKEIIQTVIQFRNEGKYDSYDMSEKEQRESIISHTHFTSSGVSVLEKNLEKLLNGDSHKFLNEEEIHNLSIKSVDFGISKALYSFINAYEYYILQISTLLSYNASASSIPNGKLIKDDKNYYKETFDQIFKIVPKSEQEELDKKIEKMRVLKNEYNPLLVFDAVHYPERYEQNFSEMLAKIKNPLTLLDYKTTVTNPNNKITNIYESMRFLENQANYYQIKKLTEYEHSLTTPSKKLMLNIRKITRDTAEITEKLLLERNKQIESGKFNPEVFTKIIENTMQTKNAPGLQVLLENKELMTSTKLLKKEDIESLLEIARKDTLSKFIYTVIKADNSTIPQINTLLSMSVVGGKMSISQDKNYYQNVMKQIQGSISPQWLENFSKNVDIVKNIPALSKEQKEELIQTAGLNPSKFNQEFLKQHADIEKPKILDLKAITRNIQKVQHAFSESTISHKIKDEIKKITI